MAANLRCVPSAMGQSVAADVSVSIHVRRPVNVAYWHIAAVELMYAATLYVVGVCIYRIGMLVTPKRQFKLSFL
jgi:hypothetical protein